MATERIKRGYSEQQIAVVQEDIIIDRSYLKLPSQSNCSSGNCDKSDANSESPKVQTEEIQESYFERQSNLVQEMQQQEISSKDYKQTKELERVKQLIEIERKIAEKQEEILSKINNNTIFLDEVIDNLQELEQLQNPSPREEVREVASERHNVFRKFRW